MSKKITFKSLDPLVKDYNVKCKENTADEKQQGLRRALLTLRRAINGNEGVTNDELTKLAQILSEAERGVAKKLEDIKMDNRALQRLQLADDIDEVVLEIITFETETDE